MLTSAWVCPPKTLCVETLTSEGDGVSGWGCWRWLSHEGGAFTDGICILIKEAPQSHRCEGTAQKSAAQRGLSPDRAGTDFPTPEL